MMPEKPRAVDIVAAREHSITSRRARVHVIVCRNLHGKARSLLDSSSLAATIDPEICAMIARELAEDILRDVALLTDELDGIEAFARQQLAKMVPS